MTSIDDSSNFKLCSYKEHLCNVMNSCQIAIFVLLRILFTVTYRLAITYACIIVMQCFLTANLLKSVGNFADLSTLFAYNSMVLALVIRSRL